MRLCSKTAEDTKSLVYSKNNAKPVAKIRNGLESLEYSILVKAWAIAFTLLARSRIPFFMIRSSRDSMLSGSEDVIGPLLTRAPLRVCVKQDAPVVDLLRRVNCDFEESRNLDFMREEDF